MLAHRGLYSSAETRDCTSIDRGAGAAGALSEVTVAVTADRAQRAEAKTGRCSTRVAAIPAKPALLLAFERRQYTSLSGDDMLRLSHHGEWANARRAPYANRAHMNHGPVALQKKPDEYLGVVTMRRVTLRTVFLVGLFTGQATSAAELTGEYLEGSWSLDGKEACGGDSFEYVTFRSDGVLETGDDGKAHGAGFWELKEDGEVIFHLATSPAFHREDLEGYGGVYDQFDIRVLTYNVEDDQFGAIGLLGGEVARATFDRCP